MVFILSDTKNKKNKVLLAADGIRGSIGILSSINKVVTSPNSIILLHVEQLVGNSINNGCGQHAYLWSGTKAYAI